MSLPLFLVDIDSNLGQPKRYSPVGVELVPMSVDSKGQPNSFMTPQQVAFFQWLNSTGRLIPCTGRTSEGLNRMILPFHHEAIVSFGGAILRPDRTPEPRWKAYIESEARKYQQALADLLDAVRKATANVHLDAALKGEFGTQLLLELKYRGQEASEAEGVAAFFQAAIPAGWTYHRNEGTLAALPPYLGKEKAAKFYVKEVAEPALFILGMGDSFTDLPFIEEVCGYAAMPINSQNFKTMMEQLRDGGLV